MTEREPVGTLAEEAARLMAVLHGWVGSEPATASEDGQREDPARPPHGDLHDDGSHDQDSAECRYCPLCQLARLARATSPDVREHLSQAALSLALAVKGMLEDPVQQTRRETTFEKIDLTEE